MAISTVKMAMCRTNSIVSFDSITSFLNRINNLTSVGFTGQVPYLFALVTVVTLFGLALSLVVIYLRCRFKISSHIRNQQHQEEDESDLSPIKYCETVFSPRHRRTFESELAFTDGRLTDVGKRLSSCNQMLKQPTFQEDANHTKPMSLSFNGSNSHMNSLISISKGHFDFDVNPELNFPCLTGSTVTTPSESLPAGHLFSMDQSNVGTVNFKPKDSVAAKNYFRRKRSNIQSSDVLHFENGVESNSHVDDLIRPMSSITNSFFSDSVLTGRKANVITVTSFGPNETIDTEVW